jgi:hypothetical protein
MQIKVLWSDGTESELEVEVPKGATPLRTSFAPRVPRSALHQQEDGSWACWRNGPELLQGYCQPEWMLGRSLCGPTWDEAQQDTAIARCLSMRDEQGHPYFTEEDWMRDHDARMRHAEKFHFHGHRTEQEAIDCYQGFLRDFGQVEIS